MLQTFSIYPNPKHTLFQQHQMGIACKFEVELEFLDGEDALFLLVILSSEVFYCGEEEGEFIEHIYSLVIIMR